MTLGGPRGWELADPPQAADGELKGLPTIEDVLDDVRCKGGERKGPADVSAILRTDSYSIRPKVTQDPGELLGPRRRTPVLFSPRAWNALSDEQRAHPLAIEIRYSFPTEELQELGRELQWPRVKASLKA